MTERRRHPRDRTFHSGTVAFRDRSPSDCVVRDVSAGGARLLLAEAEAAPADVEVDLSRGQGRRRARVIWRAEATVGVAFAPEPAVRPTPSGVVVSLEAARRERRPATDGDRLAERIARVTRPRTGPKPFWSSAPEER